MGAGMEDPEQVQRLTVRDTQRFESLATTALLKAAKLLNEIDEPDKIPLRLASIAVDLLDAERCSITAVEGDQARIQYSWTGDAWEFEDKPVSLETSITGYVTRQRKTHRSYDPDGDRQFIWHQLKPPRALLCVPLFKSGGGVRGTITLFNRRDERPFSAGQQHLAEGIAQLATAALERAELMAALIQSEELYRDLFENETDPTLLMHDLRGRRTTFNRAWEQLTGYSRDELTRMNLRDLVPPEQRQRLGELRDRVMAGEALETFEIEIVTKDGRALPFEFSQRLVSAPGKPVAIQASGREISTHKDLETRLARQAYYDMLTGLANRSLFMDRLSHALQASRRRETGVAVLFLDLDGFKQVNDRLGHHVGDELLTAVGRRLNAVLRPDDTLARWGGDEFTVLLETVAQPAEARQVAERLAEAFQTPFLLEGQSVLAGTSIGIAWSGPSGQQCQPEELVQLADAALYKAKAVGKGGVVVSDETGSHDSAPPPSP